jgi:predicted AlkP superfamily phosphohydrolase/phosphomutase
MQVSPHFVKGKMHLKARHFVQLVMGCMALPIALGAQGKHRAILVSFDGFSEQRLRENTTPEDAPSIWKLFTAGACAEASRPSFPSVTPAGHAAIWTGAYGNVNGIAAQQDGVLPPATSSIMETTNGFSAKSLRAEPLWITAAANGLHVFAHNVTQAPGAPGYPSADGPSREDSLARAKAVATLNDPRLAVVNGYNRAVELARIVTEKNAKPLPATGWTNLPARDAGSRKPLEISLPFGKDSLHVAFVGGKSYTRAILSMTRDAARGVTANLAPTDSASPRGRELARFFSRPLRIQLDDGATTFLYARLFEANPDLSKFMLFTSEARVIEANSPAVAAAYNDAVQGFMGNAADWNMIPGQFGPTIPDGGNGEAEWRYLETIELLTRQYIRGSSWGWAKYEPDLQIDYFPFPDESLHTWLGYADPSTPGVSETVRKLSRKFLAHSYSLIDIRLARLEALAGDDPHTMVVVTGEHGMRPTWRAFKPNIVLRDAGLLAVDSAGVVDLPRTVAAAPNSYWISVNRTSRKGGIVTADSVEGVLTRVEAALMAARDDDGKPIVTATFRSGAANDSLGIGGVAGGDLYFEVAPGIHVLSGRTGTVIAPEQPAGEHGYPSTSHDMQPALCAVAPWIRPHRFGMARAIDIAPTISEWLGIPAPANATGHSLLSVIR